MNANETSGFDADTIPEEITGVVHVAPGHGRRFRIGYESGDLFEEGDYFDGVTLTIEATSVDDAQWIMAGLCHGRHLPPAFGDVMAERWRQWFWKGFDHAHDDAHDEGQLALAGALYAWHGADDDKHGNGVAMARRGITPMHWPWDAKWWKPKNRRRDLVKAAALILAEIERLDRAMWSAD